MKPCQTFQCTIIACVFLIFYFQKICVITESYGNPNVIKLSKFKLKGWKGAKGQSYKLKGAKGICTILHYSKFTPALTGRKECRGTLFPASVTREIGG